MFGTAEITVTAKGDPDFDKQTRFALASALTLTAKEAQAASIREIEGSFTIRTNWDKPSNIFGVRVQPATKQNLVAIVGTAADWLEKFMRHPEGVVVDLPQGKYFAIPTKNARRTKRDIIQKGQRPLALLGKRDFIIKTKNKGILVLFQRRGRGRNSQMIAMYVLYPARKIHEKDVLFGPTQRVFEKRFADILAVQLQKAFATAR
jgi:hypothetical protein